MAKWTPPFHGDWVFSSHYGEIGPYWASYHTGTDFVGQGNLNVHPVGQGIIHLNGYDDDYGNHVSINHGNGVYTFYAHLQEPCEFPPGTEVTPLNPLGLMGETGNVTGAHTHVELRLGSDSYYGEFPIDGRRDIEQYVVGGPERPDPPRNSGAGDPDFYGGTGEVVEAIGHTEWFEAEHWMRITFRMADMNLSGSIRASVQDIVLLSGTQVQEPEHTYYLQENSDPDGDPYYVAVYGIHAEGYEGYIDSCLRMGFGSVGNSFKYQRDIVLDVGSPPGAGYIEISPNDWLGPDTNATWLSSWCAFNNARQRSTTALNAPGWTGECTVLDSPTSGGSSGNPATAHLRFDGESWAPFLAKQGDQLWSWTAGTAELDADHRDIYDGYDGHVYKIDDEPETSIEMEWNDDGPAVEYDSIIFESWTTDHGGSNSYLDVDPFYRPSPEIGTWWPGDTGEPQPPEHLHGGQHLDMDVYNRLRFSEGGPPGPYTYAGFCFIPTQIVNADFPGNYAEFNETWSLSDIRMTFLVRFRTRPYRWIYHLPPTGEPLDVRRRWEIGKR